MTNIIKLISIPKKNQKKSLTSMDWVISLAMFLLFTVWFFIMIKPAIYNEVPPDVQIQTLGKEIYNSLNYKFNSYPFYVELNKNNNQTNEKLFLRIYVGNQNFSELRNYYSNPTTYYTYWIPNTLSFYDGEYIYLTYENNKKTKDNIINLINAEKYNETIFGLYNFYRLNKTNILDNNSNYLGAQSDLSYDSTSMTNSFFKIHFSIINNLMDSLDYENKELIKDYSVEINSQEPTNLNTNTFYSFVVVDKVLSSINNYENTKISFLLPRYSHEFYSKFNFNNLNNNLIIYFELVNYTKYGISSFDEKTINYNTNNCYYENSSMLFLSGNNNTPMRIFFEIPSSKSRIKICSSGRKLKVYFNLTNIQKILWQRIFVSDDMNLVYDYDYFVKIGMPETKEGISDYSLNKLSSENNEILDLLNSYYNNFNVKFYNLNQTNKTLLIDVGSQPPKYKNVYSKQLIFNKLNFDGTLDNILFVINIW